MAIATDGSPSNSPLVLTSSTSSLPSTSLVASSNSTGSAIDRGSGAASTIAPANTVASSLFVSSFAISPSAFKPPSIRSAPNVSLATNKTLISTTQSSSRTSSLIPPSVNIGASSSAHLTTSPSATAPPLAFGTSSAAFLPSVSSSPLKSANISLTPTGSKPTSLPATSSKASGNTTTGRGSSSLSLPQAVASKAENITSSTAARVNGSITTHTFIPQVSTSDTLPSRSITPESSPASTLNSLSKPSGFFANRGAVAGVFVVVALAVLGLAILLYFGLKRYCRRHPRDSYSGEPTLPELEPSYHDHMHYRRASQIRALDNVLGAGASRPLSGQSIASEESHAFSRDTHHSTDPIMTPTRFPIHTNGYKNMIPFPPSTKPFAHQSRVSVQSAVESSPSIYPPTLPSVIDEEESYWQQQGFERVVDPQESGRTVEKHVPQQQFTPPESMLGLWSNTSQSTFRQHSSSGENELVGNLDPRMEPASVHKGSTAPIASPPRLQIHGG